MHRLGLQPEVHHNGNSALCQTLNHIVMAIDAFEFHRVRTRAHQSLRAIERRDLAFAKGLWSWRALKVHHHGGSVADQYCIDGASRRQAGERVVVTRHHGNLTVF